jgi:uncharacterized membrane protein
MSLVGGRNNKDADSIAARRIAALGNPRRMAWNGLWFALAAWFLMALSRGIGSALVSALHLDRVDYAWVPTAIDALLAVAALVVAWRGITSSRRARGHPSGLAKGLATGTLVFGWLVLAMGVVNLVEVVQAKQTSTPATSSLTPTSLPTANASGGIYRNDRIGLMVDVPYGLAADASSSSAQMTMLKKAIPSTGKGGINSRIGGLVAFYAAYWSGSDEPGGFALMWRQPALFSRAEFARFNTARRVRSAAANVQSLDRSRYGPNVTAVATHVGHFPAVKVTIRTTTAAGVAITIRWFWLFTPTAEYAFYGWTRTSREKLWLAMFDHITSSTTVSKY